MSEAIVHQFKVGDELAFQTGNWQGGWEIHKITKITPSGRLDCGRWTLNPDLSIRGSRSHYGPYKAYAVTDSIREKHLHGICISKIQHQIKWKSLPASVLSQVVNIAEQAMSEVKEDDDE
jgi:hypothetical protein